MKKESANKVNNWIAAITREDGETMSIGSLRTLKMISDEILTSTQQTESMQTRIKVLEADNKTQQDAINWASKIMDAKNAELMEAKKEIERLTKIINDSWLNSQVPLPTLNKNT